MTIGEIIQWKRKAAHITQKQLGMMVGFPEASAERMIQHWEHGRRPIRVEDLRPLCRALHCTLEELIPRD